MQANLNNVTEEERREAAEKVAAKVGTRLLSIAKVATDLQVELTRQEKENAELTRKGGDLCSVLGNLAIHIHDLGLRKAEGFYGDWNYRNERADTAEERLRVAEEWWMVVMWVVFWAVEFGIEANNGK